MKVILVGSGNVATVLGVRIRQAGHEIIQVLSKTPAHALRLAGKLEAAYCPAFEELSKQGDIYIIAVNDAAVASVAKDMAPYLPHTGLLVHTAGAVPIGVLQGLSETYAVLYPLQSIRAERTGISEIPLLIDANSSAAKDKIRKFAQTISGTVADANDEVRTKLHVAAVLSNNFTNFLYALTQYYCKAENLDFALLLPLLNETVQRLAELPAASTQTGPAMRSDFQTIEKHLALLGAYPEIKKVYGQITAAIQGWYAIK